MYPRFLLILYINRSFKIVQEYYKLDCDNILQILEGYRAVLKMRGIMEEFWARQKMAT